MKFEVGKCYLFNLFPGWLITGRVTRDTDAEVTISDGAYLESVKAGNNTSLHVVDATPEQQTAIITSSYRLKNGWTMNKAFISQSCESTYDTVALARGNGRALSGIPLGIAAPDFLKNAHQAASRVE